MRARVLLAATLLGAAGAVLPAAPASACIDLYVPVIGSFCHPDPCPWLEETTGVEC
jgi:hypothetical protein